MPRSVVKLPPGVKPPYEVYISGVPQRAGVDYSLEGDKLVFDRELRKDKISKWRWFIGGFGFATYRQDDSVDVRYELNGRPMVAEGLEIEPD